MEYEGDGFLVPEGQGARAVAEGLTRRTGVEVHPSGRAQGGQRPIHRCTLGLSMHAITAMQLMGRGRRHAGGRSRLGGIFNMGGTRGSRTK